MGVALVLRLALACRPWLGVIRGAMLMLRLIVATDLVSRPLFAWPFATATRPSSSTTFRTSMTSMCLGLPIGSSFKVAFNLKGISTIRIKFESFIYQLQNVYISTY